MECFLNIKTEYLWEHELFENADFFGNQNVTIPLKAVHISMDSYNQDKRGRYGKNGYLYQIDQPTNPETREKSQAMAGTIEICNPIPWNIK